MGSLSPLPGERVAGPGDAVHPAHYEFGLSRRLRVFAQTAFLRQAAEGDRPARHLHRGDAVLPFVSRRARQMIDRPRRQEHRCSIETAGPARAGTASSPEFRAKCRGHARTPAGLGASRFRHPDRSGSPEPGRVRPVVDRRTAPPSHEAATANRVSPRPGRSWHRRSRSASRRRRSAASPAIRGNGTGESSAASIDAISISSSRGVTNPPAWDNPARAASPNRSGWEAVRFILREPLSRHPMWEPTWLRGRLRGRRRPMGTDGRRDALTGRYRRATAGAGCGRAAAGAPRLS